MPIMHAVILGIIQGLTEALPVSSSAHLVLFPWFFNWHYQGLSFDVALHMGTALAFGIYFFKDWVVIIRARDNLLWCILIGTVPAAAAGLILEKKAETVFRSPLVMMSSLAVFAVVLWLADHYGKKEKSIERMDIKTAVTIGFAQIVALIPGVSRSGITITAGLFKGFSREAAARFSFLLATPIVVAAVVLKLPKLSGADLNMAFWAGVFSSAVSGFIAIHFLLNLIKKYSFNVFVWYRIVLAVVILIVFLLKGGY